MLRCSRIVVDVGFVVFIALLFSFTCATTLRIRRPLLHSDSQRQTLNLNRFQHNPLSSPRF